MESDSEDSIGGLKYVMPTVSHPVKVKLEFPSNIFDSEPPSGLSSNNSSDDDMEGIESFLFYTPKENNNTDFGSNITRQKRKSFSSEAEEREYRRRKTAEDNAKNKAKRISRNESRVDSSIDILTCILKSLDEGEHLIPEGVEAIRKGIHDAKFHISGIKYR